MVATLQIDSEFLAAVRVAVVNDEAELSTIIEELVAPIYLTDAEGYVTHFNQACLGFTGRVPGVGKDRWCVTWRLYTEAGVFLPHEDCPMAHAILTGHPIRGVQAVAERPDGTRVAFVPLPTPIFGRDGDLVGAVNVLIDVADVRQIADLRSQAERCRRLASGVDSYSVVATLSAMASEYETKARQLGGCLAISSINAL